MSKFQSAPLDDLDKGGDAVRTPVCLGDIGGQGWNLLAEDLALPVAVIKDTALRHNSRWMQEFLRLTGAQIAPHGKTSMAPELFDLQLADGAWGITLSTPHQIRVARRFGHNRLFIANQMIGRKAIEYLFTEIEAHPDLEIYCLVDSLENVEQLEAAGARLGGARKLNVLVEVGFQGGRTGCRSPELALAIARRLAASARLNLAGVEGFEGIILGPTPEERLDRVRAFLTKVAQVAEACDAEGLFQREPVMLSAGGTGYFDVVVEVFDAVRLRRSKQILIRSGCYLTHDSVMYTRAFEQLRQRAPMLSDQLGEMRPALEVWAYVQSRPEPGRIIAALGKRDISYDDMPVPLLWSRPGAEGGPAAVPSGHEVLALNDQHAYLRVPEDSPLTVGDMVAFGISHPCLTFDKWRLIHRVDDDYNILGAFRTYF